MRLLIFTFLLLSYSAFGQKPLQTIPLSDSGSTLNSMYLKSLDSTFQRVRLIGLGESTHGTSEFTIIRAELFRYLVEHHDYTVFFLEADHNACTRVNRYIQGENDTVTKAMMEIRLWPWLTQELMDLIEWMREYNHQHENRLEFVGCDMQLIKDDIEELPRLLSSSPKYEPFLANLPDLNLQSTERSVLESKQREWLQFAESFQQSFPEEEPLIINSVSQWFEKQLSKDEIGNIRDSCMGNNIADYLDRHPNAKGIYFAHNGHVGKLAYPYKGYQEIFKRAGHHLDLRLKDQYFAIGLDFHTGSFNAINYVDSMYVMEYFTFLKNHKKSLSRIVMGDDDHVKFVYSTALKNKKHLQMNGIGAIYGRSNTGQKIYRYRTLNLDHFDAFIVINKGTPTHLLKITSKESQSK